MCRLDRRRQRIEIGLKRRPPRVRGSEGIVKGLAKVAGAVHNRGASGIEPLQMYGSPAVDQSRQRREPGQVAIRRQVLDWRRRGPLVQGVYQVESWMTAAPFERIGAAHSACSLSRTGITCKI